MTPTDPQAQPGEAAPAGAADWVQQTQALTEAWTNAQAQIWTDWLKAMQPAADTPGRLAQTWMQQWQALTQGAVPGATTEATGTSRELMERILSGEQAYLSFVEMTLAMMKAVAPAIDVGEDWVSLLRRFLDQMKDDALHGRSAWMHTAALAGVTGEANELWSLYVAELQRLYGPWATAYTGAAQNLGQAGRGDTSALRRSYAGFLDAYETTFGRFLSAPSVGYTRESSERLLKSFDAWVDMNRAALDFQTEITNEGMHAVEALIARLVEMGEKGEKITSLRQFFDLWSDTVDGVYYQLFGSDSFAMLQGRYVNAAMEFRKRQADLLAEMTDAIGLPGRQEVDEIHRRMHDTRREIRTLKREVTGLRAELATARQAAADAAAAATAAAAEAAAARAAAAEAATVREAAATATETRKAAAGKRIKREAGAEPESSTS